MLARIIAPAAVAVTLLAAGWGLWGALQAEQERSAALTRQLQAAEAQADQARLAREVEAARARAARVEAQNARAAIEDVLSAETGECADAPLDDALRDALERVRRPSPRPRDGGAAADPAGDADALPRE